MIRFTDETLKEARWALKDSPGNILDDVPEPAIEPFVVGNRYRTRGGGDATVTAAGADYIIVQYDDGTKTERKLDGTHAINGLLGSHQFPRDLIPGAIPDKPVENASSAETEAAYLKRRAERAEVAIERARAWTERTLKLQSNTEADRFFNEGLRSLAKPLGLTITPSRELMVTWEGGK